MTVFALAIPFVGTAIASHSTDNTHDLEVTPDTDSNPTGTGHTLTATVTGGNVDGAEVDFEVESGPAIRANCTPGAEGTACTGGTASDDGNSPTSPDLTCITDATGTCQVFFTSDTSGTNIIRAWVDDDQNNATFDADATEGVNAGPTDDGGSATNAQPGDRTEVDDTDVVSKTWFAAQPTDARLDCTPETATNPSTGEGSSETYTCTAFQDENNNEVQDAGEAAIAGFEIDGENLNGPNDPDDNQTGSTTNTADYGCTTGNDGSCQVTVHATEAQTGTANICFWLDTDRDNIFNSGGDPEDGGQCDVERQGEDVDGGDDTRDDNITDVVSKTWVARGAAANIDCAPETDQNVRGTTHTVTCTVTDFFGTAVQGASVDFTVTGRNPQTAENRTTDANGQVTLTYQDSDAPLTSEGQADTIEGCLEQSPDVVTGCPTPGDDDGAHEDVVQKFWFTTLPVAADIVFDADANDAAAVGNPGGCEASDANAEDTATNDVLADPEHEVCATVTNAQGQPIIGQEVTFTLSGGNAVFYDDADNNDTQDTNEQSGTTTFTTTTNAAGQAFADLTGTQTGDVTITATSGNVSDSGVKTYTTDELNARNIDCDPNTATNPPGSEHVVTCTVTDRFGNPVPNADLTFTETGAGRIQTANQQTDANGQAEVVTSTTQTEEGEQTITATLSDDTRTAGNNNDECEAAANRSPGATTDDAEGAPAGNCVDTVTKTWAEQAQPQPECSDGIDNDGDELIDFPDDPGCESAEDNDETDPTQEPPVQERGPCQGFRQGETHVGAAGTGDIVVGTPGNDILVGSDGDDIICGLGGDDVIRALGGDDQVVGNAGNDTIQGNGGKDEINGNANDDTIDGNRKNDIIKGARGDDTLRGNRGWDTVRGGSGNDTLQGGRGNDILRGGGGNDTLKGFHGDDLLNGGKGTDTCVPGQGNDRVRNCER